MVRTEAQEPKLSSKEPDLGLGDSGLASGLLTAFNHETKAWTGLSFISTSAIRAALPWGSSVAGVFRSAKDNIYAN